MKLYNSYNGLLTMNDGITHKERLHIDKVVDFAKHIDDNGFQHKVAAAIVYKNKIISLEHNVDKSHTFQKRFAKNEHAIFFHAETSAIHKALKILGEDKLSKATLVVVRLSSVKSKCRQRLLHHTLATSKPCEGCSSCINHYGIKKVIHSVINGFEVYNSVEMVA